MPTCRFCKKPLQTIFADLNMAPLSNSYVSAVNRYAKENTYPLITYVCDACFLVQTHDFVHSQEMFTKEYAYRSSCSNSWLKHCQQYVDTISQRLVLTKKSKVLEIASNDGYLLQYFQQKNIPCQGIEPCQDVAELAIAKGIPTVIEFWTETLANTLQPDADLICMCNVLAHVPDINDFTKAIKHALAPTGTVTIEFPHIYNLIQYNQFDTIYHEHYSYLSLLFVRTLFEKHNLTIYDVETLSTHGGSLRVYGCHKEHLIPINTTVEKILHAEKEQGLDNTTVYRSFQKNIQTVKNDLLQTLIKIKNREKSIVAYGASAKGNTLFNYCGISYDFIDYSVDMNTAKQNTFLPGSHIPVYPPTKISETKPDYILITPWNIKQEIINQLRHTNAWDCKYIVAIPRIEIGAF